MFVLTPELVTQYSLLLFAFIAVNSLIGILALTLMRQCSHTLGWQLFRFITIASYIVFCIWLFFIGVPPHYHNAVVVLITWIASFAILVLQLRFNMVWMTRWINRGRMMEGK